MKIATIKTGLASLAMLPGLVMAAPAVADKADNAFMMICTALVLFMTIPGIALFYGGLIRGKNVLSMLTQVTVTFALVCILWVVYGYSLAEKPNSINNPQRMSDENRLSSGRSRKPSRRRVCILAI
jgi:ammonium transporter, Amt family